MTSKLPHHEDPRRIERGRTSSDRAFGVVFSGVFTVIGLWPLLGGGPPRWWSLVVAAVLVALAWLRPLWLAPLNRWWTRFGLLLHRIVSPIIMGVLFFAVITPFGLGWRLVRRDPMSLRFDSEASTYWIRREPPGPPPASIERQF